jgi:hypothetical protein
MLPVIFMGSGPEKSRWQDGRVTPTTAELHGETATRSYLLMATLSGTQDMVLNYLAAPLDSTGSYQGSAHFSRTR